MPNQFEKPVFEVVEDFTVESEVCADTSIRVVLRRQLNYKPSRVSTGPFFLDLYLGRGGPRSYGGVSESIARETSCRFLLEHVNGIAPTRH